MTEKPHSGELLIDVAGRALACIGLNQAAHTAEVNTAFEEEDRSNLKAISGANPDAKVTPSSRGPTNYPGGGACASSDWPRACSLWTSFHGMALRAEAASMGKPFLTALSTLVAVGATSCGGCTWHFRAIMQPALDDVVADLSDLNAIDFS